MSGELWCLIQKSDGKVEVQESLDGGKQWQQLKTPNGVFGDIVCMRTAVGVEYGIVVS